MRATLWAVATAALVAGCGASSGGAPGTTNAADAKAPASKKDLTLVEYLDLGTDALTSDKVDWKKALETARARVLEEPDAEKTYVVNMPVQWFNAEYDVLIYVFRRADDRTIAKGAPKRGFAVILNATTGAVKLAGAYSR